MSKFRTNKYFLHIYDRRFTVHNDIIVYVALHIIFYLSFHVTLSKAEILQVKYYLKSRSVRNTETTHVGHTLFTFK